MVALRFVEAIFLDIKREEIHLEKIDDERLNYAWLLRSVYRDKPDISLLTLHPSW